MQTQAGEEQVVYAKILEKGMYFGLLLMVITFAIYVFGIMKPAVPLNEVANYWKLPVATHAAVAGHPAKLGYLDTINQNFLHLDQPVTGWGWMKLINYSDFLNFIPVAILAGITLLCYLAIIPVLQAKKDTAYTVMAILEVLILTLAASGLLAVGGH
ncbi:MAG: hypothetical protein A2511_08685 [Deltaproteobacteria bacterium RIFOXYD12_FULL_50_9]|nr:MAG: hypothetical protein A2511_08685 [Deltaproteobacteria bacterium RIFOXYD12_FULL_50_9]